MKLDMTLTTENFTLAEVRSTSDLHVSLVITKTDQWNAEGLRKLAAMLQGVAGMLTTEQRP